MTARMHDSGKRPKFARFKDLTDGGKADLIGTFKNMASLLKTAGFEIAIGFHIHDKQTVHRYSLHATSKKTTVNQGGNPKTDLEVITTAETWREIARGAMSPLDAFGDGKLRLRGDTGLGAKAMKHLAGTPGRCEIC